VAIVVVAISASSVVFIEGARQINSIKTVDIPQDSVGPPPDIDAMEGGFNLLLVGSDTGIGQGDLGAHRGSAALNDVNILLHVSADHTNAVAVSFPRDMVMPIPSCTNPDTGKKSYAMVGQPINVALSYGGLGCAAAVVENFTGVPVNFAGLITFQGVIQMSNAVGGVEVCLAEGVHDKFTGFNREAGTWNLSGAEALQFLRTRHGVGDGSDLTRISSQQVFLSSLVRTLKSNDTLGDGVKLYGIANAATQNMLLSSNLKSLDTMVSIAKALKDIPLDRVTFVQYPGSTGQPGIYEKKVKPNTAIGGKLFDKIRADEPFLLEKAGDGIGSVLDPNAAPLPGQTASPDTAGLETISGIRGQTAADQTCSAKLGK
jgi:LCP family protein required for cell wall assembly